MKKRVRSLGCELVRSLGCKLFFHYFFIYGGAGVQFECKILALATLSAKNAHFLDNKEGIKVILKSKREYLENAKSKSHKRYLKKKNLIMLKFGSIFSVIGLLALFCGVDLLAIDR
jgi:hypothetical protein